MNPSFRTGALVAAVLAISFLLLNTLFVVRQTEHAIVLRLGDPSGRDPISTPGLYAKIPFIENVVFVDKRILDLDRPAQEVIASDQKRLVVDSFTRYQVQNPLLVFQAVGGTAGANARLSSIVDSTVRGVLADASSSAIIRDNRAALMQRIREDVDRQARTIGVRVVDVRLRRVDFPEANSKAVYSRMTTERQREAADIRAQGSEQAQGIRARAERDVATLVGEANRKAEETRGAADAERNRVFADAFQRDPDFFGFYRSMQAYETGLKSGDTRLVLSPDSEFFRYFNDPNGRAQSPAAPTPAPAR